MIDLGRRTGREVVCLLTDMEQPLGRAVGNALEIREALQTLRGEGPPDLQELVVDAVTRLLAFSDLDVDEPGARRRAEAAVADGSAIQAYERWVRAQGGDPDEEALPIAPVVREVPAPSDGYVAELGAIAVAMVALRLGAGRRTKDDAIDHAVGVRCLRKRGDAVARGEPLAEVHARDDSAAETAAAEIATAYRLDADAPAARPILIDVVTG
jgi:pyrimidine-nucleoside phosphorylase